MSAARITYLALNPLGWCCQWLANRFQEWAYRLVRCPDCGRSRYYGAPCAGRAQDQR